eukprot:145513_1
MFNLENVDQTPAESKTETVIPLTYRNELKWKCSSCSTENLGDRNHVLCVKCFTLDSDVNLYRAKALYMLGNIEKPSTALIPLKIPFFVSPLSPPIITFTKNLTNDGIWINFEIDIYDNKGNEKYHIERVKFDLSKNNSYHSTFTKHSLSPYYNVFPKFFNKPYHASYSLDVYVKCYKSNRVSPKQILQFDLFPIITNNNTNSRKHKHKIEHNAQYKPKRRKYMSQPLSSFNSNINNVTNSHNSNNNNNSIVNNSDNNNSNNDNHNNNFIPQIPHKIWYKQNPDGRYEAIADELLKKICAMKIGETKSISIISQPYIITKISYNKCTLMHKETNKKTELICEEYGWCYQDIDGLFKPYSDDINNKLLFATKGSSIRFSLKNNNLYEITKLEVDSGKQKNLSTGTERNVKYRLKFQTIYDPIIVSDKHKTPKKQKILIDLTNTKQKTPKKQKIIIDLANTKQKAHKKQKTIIDLTNTKQKTPKKQKIIIDLANTKQKAHKKQKTIIDLTNTK